MPDQSMAEQVADAVAREIKDRVEATVSAIQASGGAGFQAHITPKQALEFYKAKVINPDGSPNMLGLQELIAGDGSPNNPGIGPDGWAEVVQGMADEWARMQRGG